VGAEVQLLAVTHSPLVMASVEPEFDPKRDAWFDLDLVPPTAQAATSVSLTQRPFVRLGEVGRWLVSDAFDMASARSVQAEQALQEAANLLAESVVDHDRAQALDVRLRGLLGDTDPFWIRWRFVGEKQGWLA
jgi:hypothetical protein